MQAGTTADSLNTALTGAIPDAAKSLVVRGTEFSELTQAIIDELRDTYGLKDPLNNRSILSE